MQTTVCTMETASRYNNNDASSSHNSGGNSFSGGTGIYRSNGPHNESARVLNQNSAYGAQFNSAEKSKCQNYGCENDNNPEYSSSWQNMNSSANSSNWNEGKPVIGRSIHGGRDNSVTKEENMSVENDTGTFSNMLGATGGTDNYTDDKSGNGNFAANSQRSMQMPRLGLLGGGEGSMGTSNWSGSQGPTSTAWGGSRQGSSEIGGSSNAGTPTKPQGSWAQAAGKGLNPPCSASGTPMTADSPALQHDMPPTARDLAEKEAKDLRMKAAFSEGWGVNPVNQDTPWDVPELPALETGKENPTPPSAVWRAPVNNGTEVWENNLRVNKGSGPVAAPAPATNVPPWGHTPATNIGGHWGDDDSSSSTWSGPPNSNPNAASWSDSNAPSASGGNGNMWNNSAPSEKHWSGNPSWADGACGSEPASWNNGRGRSLANWSPMATPKKEMPPSGWEPPAPSPPPNRRAVGSNFDDGTAVWGNPQRQGKVSHWKDMPSAKPIINSGGPMVGPNGMIPNMSTMPPSGPGMIRIPGSNKVDGSATWKQPPPVGRNSNWQDMPPHRDSPTICNWSEDGGQMKNYGNAHGPSYGGGWNDQSNNMGWGTKPKPNPANWADGQVDTSSWLGPAKQRMERMWSAVSEDMSEKCSEKNDSKTDVMGYWPDANTQPMNGHIGRKLKGGKPLCKDIVHASKAFRLLTELGYRKEEVENALRNHNMDFSQALSELQGMGPPPMDMDGGASAGRKLRGNNMYDDVPMSDHTIDSFNPENLHGPNNFQSAINFPGMGHNFKQPPPKGPNNNLVNSALNGQQLPSAANLSPALLQKLLQQQQQQQQQQQSLQMLNLNNIQGFGNSKFNNNAQLRHLCQQIQMAVSAGHLNAQILNQPLSPQTLQLLYQLLQQIKALAGLQNQLVQATTHGTKQGLGNNNATVLQINVHIAQTKSRIANLQNQICVHQAQFMKQQLAQQQPNLTPHHATQSSMDIFKPGVDPMSGMQTDFRDLSLKDMSHQNHQSRLNQWKLSSMEKEENQMTDVNPISLGNSGDFSRAPGPINSKQTSNSGSSMHPLLEQTENTWSGLGGRGESSWPDATTSSDNASGSNASLSTLSAGQASDNKDGSHVTTGSTAATNSSTYNLTDLVPEFEPGKPWKGTQLKNIEDDPHITPGSIARSPLSVNNIKESNLFWPSKSSPANSSNDGVGLPSNTWIYSTPPVGTPNSSNASLKSGNGKSSWNSEFGTTTDLWGSMPNKNSRNNPPPGISNPGWERQYNSTFLLLRNLTPQIDGSTLKTLCMQHGPLQMFHLFLNRGVALVRYSSREEATKAQSALNNCVLGNTTMLADIPNESEIQQYLQVASGQGGGNSWPPSQQSSSGNSSYQSGGSSSTYYGSSSNGNGGSNWNSNAPTSQLWSFSNSSLWGSSQSSNDHDASTNPINSYLPNDLLGGEPM